MWAGEEEDPPCITIFSAPNYCDHMNPGSILITGTASAKASILMYEESKTKPYYLPDLEIGGYPDDPFDAISWFQPAMNEWVSEIFTKILNKMRMMQQDEEDDSPISRADETLQQKNNETFEDIIGQYESQFAI